MHHAIATKSKYMFENNNVFTLFVLLTIFIVNHRKKIQWAKIKNTK